MTDPKPLTAEELDHIEGRALCHVDFRVGPENCVVSPGELERMIAQSRRCIELEAKSATLSRLDEFLREDPTHETLADLCDQQANYRVHLSSMGESVGYGEGPTYWEALRDALGKLGTEAK